MFITFEMYEKMRNDGVADIFDTVELENMRNNLMVTYGINTLEDLVPLVFDFEISRVVNIFKYKPFEFLRTFYLLDGSIQYIYSLLDAPDVLEYYDYILCGLYDIVFFGGKIYDNTDYLLSWVEDGIWHYNDNEEGNQKEEKDFDGKINTSAFKRCETDSPVVLKMVDYIKEKYNRKNKYMKYPESNDESFLGYLGSEMFNYVAGL